MKYQINLLPQKKQTTIDKITYFALHYLRYILVITQLVAIGVFFYRFKVDQDIVDLKDTLTQKQAIVENTKDLLETVKDLDGKIKNVKKLYSGQQDIENQYLYVSAKIPSDIAVKTLAVSPEKISLNGEAVSSDAVRLLYEKLREEKQYKNISLSSVNKSEAGFTFTLTLSEFITQNGSQTTP